jgi:glucan biosynthesis protein C
VKESERYHALDAVRAFALLIGIALHSTVSFLPGMREGRWPISDDSQSDALAGVFFVVHTFRMSLFYAIAGFFAHVLLVRLGVWGLIQNRLRRIALPFVAALVVVVPLIIPAFKWAQSQLHLAWPPTVQPPIPNPHPPPWVHLWFLYLLLVLYALVLMARTLVVALDRRAMLPALLDRAFAALIASRLGPILLAAPTAITLYFTPWWQLWTGIPAPIMGFVPNFPAVLAFGSAFTFGWFLHRQPALLDTLKRDWILYVGLAGLSTVIAIVLVGVRSKFYHYELPTPERIAYAASYNLATWCWMFGLIGAAMRFLGKPSATWRYFSDASFFMYILHMPIVYTLEASMIRWPVHWSVKYPLVLLPTIALLVVIYHYGVRSTFVGQFLNGRKYPRNAGIAGEPRHA